MRNIFEVIKANKKRCALVASAIFVAAILCMLVACSASTVSGNVGAAEAIGEALSTIADAADAVPSEESGTEEALPAQEGSLSESAENNGTVGLTEESSSGASQISPSASTTTASSIQQTQERPTPSTSQKKWVEDTQQVWVEDRAAWSEQVPVYGNKEVSICNVCGADITGNAAAHGKAHMLAGEGSGHHSEVRQEITGYNTVNHPAEGHYETRVTGGHWE
mgnify:CR=1 FL=1